MHKGTLLLPSQLFTRRLLVTQFALYLCIATDNDDNSPRLDSAAQALKTKKTVSVSSSTPLDPL